MIVMNSLDHSKRKIYAIIHMENLEALVPLGECVAFGATSNAYSEETQHGNEHTPLPRTERYESCLGEPYLNSQGALAPLGCFNFTMFILSRVR
jgi:hypothetical protein